MLEFKKIIELIMLPVSQRPTRRLFFSLWPGDAVRTRLAHERLAVAKDCQGRAMREDTLHLTLLFLGDTPALRLPEVIACGDAISTETFDLTVNAFACFPKLKIGYLGMTDPPRALFDLQSALCEKAKAAQFAFHERDFNPHITAARDCKHIPSPGQIDAIGWHVDHFVLIDSDLHPPAPLKAPVYTVLKTWPLRA